MTSPTQRTLALFKKEGFTCGIVEHYNIFAHVRQDLFNFIDIVAIRSDISGVLGAQVTTRGHVNERVDKIISTPAAKTWLEAGNKIQVIGWSKKGATGKRKLWEVYKKEIFLQDVM